MRKIQLFKPARKRAIIIGMEVCYDSSLSDFGAAYSGPWCGDKLRVTDTTHKSQKVLLDFDLEGRLLGIELRHGEYANEIKIMERNYNGDFYIYFENLRNLSPGNKLARPFDYWNQDVCIDPAIAKALVDELEQFMKAIVKYEVEKGRFRIPPWRPEGDWISDEKPENIADLLEKAKRFNWESSQQNEPYTRAYPTPITVLPPEVRPDQNPVFSVIQLTQGCRLKDERGPCSFCGSYKGIQYREKTLDELSDHIAKVKDFTGEGWKYVRKIFLADADPLNTRTPTEAYLEFLRNQIPKISHFESFASTVAILSKTEQEWARLKELGLNMLYWGVESADDQTLRMLHKPHTQEMLYKAGERLKQVGINYAIILLAGVGTLDPHMGEGDVRDNSHVRATSELMSFLNPPMVYVSNLSILPGTRLYQRAQLGDIRPLSQPEVSLQNGEIRTKTPFFCKTRGQYGMQFITRT
ncbi:MAG: radical SAM protein [Nanoarchaeota archaeon]|nr:radical SAM protein [Nanoarchaeota archaeon]MBU1005792.1 radical SAM protein [Nanoarchaeota archaeon]MBU1946576.1 radical SAM protein [Nanoarchaeota archaeon]